MENRGLSRTQGATMVLTLTFLQSLGSNIRLGIAKVAQKSLFHFVMGVLITHDQCGILIHVVFKTEPLITFINNFQNH